MTTHWIRSEWVADRSWAGRSDEFTLPEGDVVIGCEKYCGGWELHILTTVNPDDADRS